MRQKALYYILFSIILIILFQCISYPSKGETVTDSVILIIDASSSMGEYNEDDTALKIDDAKKAAVDAMDELNGSTEVALIVFYDCGKIILEQPFTTDLSYVKARIENIKTDGYTPLADSIEMAILYMKNNSSGDEGVIIILTDGGETCKGDPVASASSVRMMVIDCRLHVINYGSENADQLTKIAQAGKGRYYAPRNAEELSDNIRTVTNPDNWPLPNQEMEESDSTNKELLSTITWYITLGLLLFGGILLFIVTLNYLYNVIGGRSKKDDEDRERKWWLILFWEWLKLHIGGWRRKRRERRREARERKWAEREMRAEERRREKERRRREGSGGEICFFHPLKRSMSRKNEELRQVELEQRLAKERRLAEEERLAKDREEEEKKRQMAEERKRAERERQVAENRKRKELFSMISELARNEFGIAPPDDLEAKIKGDPYAAEADVNAYREMIEAERERRLREKEEKKKIALEQKRASAQVTKKESGCPSCGEGIRYVAKYGRWYCDKCAKYLPKSFKRH